MKYNKGTMRDKGKRLEDHFNAVDPGLLYIMVKPDNRVMISILGVHETLTIEDHMLLRSPSPDWAIAFTRSMSIVFGLFDVRLSSHPIPASRGTLD